MHFFTMVITTQKVWNIDKLAWGSLIAHIGVCDLNYLKSIMHYLVLYSDLFLFRPTLTHVGHQKAQRNCSTQTHFSFIQQECHEVYGL